MTNSVDSEAKSNVVDFKPQTHLAAEAQLQAFIEWAKVTLPKGVPNWVSEGVRWEDDSWQVHGFVGCSFSALGSTVNAPIKMQLPFLDFAKALLVYRRIYLTKRSVKEWFFALKVLELALVELTGSRDVTRISAAVCNRASERMQAHWVAGNNAYNISKALEKIVSLMRDKGLLRVNFRWTSPVQVKSGGSLKQQKEDREKKLPNPDAINALGEIFNNRLTNPLDIVVTSACAIMLSAPSRVGELQDVELDCLVFKEGADGSQRMFLRWYAAKINQVVLKPVVKPEMEPVVERAIAMVRPLTDEARTYAAWLEDHPDEFPPHEGVPKKGPDDPLTYGEMCGALKLVVPDGKNPRTHFRQNFWKTFETRKGLSSAAQAIVTEMREGWDPNPKRIYVKSEPGIQGFEYNDRFLITLNKLNVLMREKYLPKHFPYTTPHVLGKARVKYRDALFTVRTGALADGSKNTSTMVKDFGVEIAASGGRLGLQLAGTPTNKTTSIFERHGYSGLKVNTHAFRHELNTRMHQAGLSQLLIDAFSGRTTMGSTYNHETAEERAQRVARYHPKTKYFNAVQSLEKIKTNQPLSLSDVKDLYEGEQDRIIHQTHIGICIHNFEASPCPKMGACLSCGRLGCVKGDEVKLANLKDEREGLKRRYDKAICAKSRGDFGASEWVKEVGMDLYKCEALIRTLENPEMENGDIVWNADNGWTLTKNAAVMAGLVDVKAVEAESEQQELLSLDDLSAMLANIEDQ